MSNYTAVYGIIEVPRFKGLEKANEINEVALSNLPEIDDWPFLSKTMFCTTAISASYENQLIHFPASMKGIEEEWKNWVKKFENLLSNMSWITVTVHLEMEYHGEHKFIWLNENYNPYKPVNQWVYEGDPNDLVTS
jgi:hypothetical protein